MRKWRRRRAWRKTREGKLSAFAERLTRKLWPAFQGDLGALTTGIEAIEDSSLVDTQQFLSALAHFYPEKDKPLRDRIYHAFFYAVNVDALVDIHVKAVQGTPEEETGE